MSDIVSNLVNAGAGEYIEDDPRAWEAFCAALARYLDYLPSLQEHFGDDAIQIVAGSMLGFMADQHGVFLSSRPQPFVVMERLDTPGNRADGVS